VPAPQRWHPASARRNLLKSPDKGNLHILTRRPTSAAEIGVSMDESTARLELSGTLNLFGFPPRQVSVVVLPRNRRWRALRASVFFGGGLLLAPLVGVVPPHAPWVAAALGFGGFFGIRKWRERFTLVSFEGSCPRCGESVRIRAGTPLRATLSVPCEGCHYDAQLTVELPRGPTPPPPFPTLPSEAGTEGDRDP